MIDGNDLQPIATATAATTSHTFHIPANTLLRGRLLGARQVLDDEKCPSVPRPWQIIGSAPESGSGPLPPVVFSGGLYSCMDWVLLTGLVIGATVELRFLGQVVATATVTRPSMAIRLNNALSTHERVQAIQTFATPQGLMQSTPVQSLPPESLQPGIIGNQLQTPFLHTPHPCETTISVDRIVAGASLTAEIDQTRLIFPAYGASFWGTLSEPLPNKGRVSLVQSLENCSSDFQASKPFALDIQPLKELARPTILGPICWRTDSVRCGRITSRGCRIPAVRCKSPGRPREDCRDRHGRCIGARLRLHVTRWHG